MDENMTTEQSENTQPQAVNVDTDAIVSQASAKATEQAEKKMQAVFKSMLQQEGLDTETINSVTAEWKAKNKPAEPEKPQESEEYKTLLGRLEALEQTNTKAKAELVERKQLDYLKSKGIPESHIDFYQFKASKLVKDDVSFEQAAEQYIKDNPIQSPPPEYATGKSKGVENPTEKDEAMAKIKSLMGIK